MSIHQPLPVSNLEPKFSFPCYPMGRPTNPEPLSQQFLQWMLGSLRASPQKSRKKVFNCIHILHIYVLWVVLHYCKRAITFIKQLRS